MSNDPLLLILAAGLLAFGLISQRIERLALTAPMLFLLLGVASGPLLFDWSAPAIESSALKIIAELTLALILFTDASQVQRSHLVKFENLPIRLLGIGLPLTMLAGAAIAFILYPGHWQVAVMIGIILAPTDAALAQSVFSASAIKEKLRHSITVESGLNDGLALPFLLLIIAIASAGDLSTVDPWYWGNFLFKQIALGALVGIAVGYLGGYLLEKAGKHDWMDPVFQRLASVALALVTYTGAEHSGGNGFIAVFMAGLFLHAGRTMVVTRLKEFGEAEGQLLTLVMFFLFGLIYVPDALPQITSATILYALLSLTLIRIIPVLLALSGTGLSIKEKLFLGWFGPRGIASILYLLMVIEQLGFAEQLPGYQLLFPTVVTTVVLSIFVHGMSVPFWIRWLKR
ncbi:MAG: sodium:proton antiporter [Oceanospirillaceae bacterium]|jgi:NhaP-type Na+/H+ or K+/H+ antiporter|uniref:cation:proton antiporter n=1 Tax=unclassified Thalassolituus TaxID=2624967 RepID=UPI000C0CF99D|nr:MULTISPECIES: cation:proton antiporter [unclassified Thalassolituus]MAE34069.1 sodium:proton antiporter [Oceanospirillaceae bacterium]MBN57610.1 sodium:proton antiporter [Oceanospirillaceae bacterium]MDQ4423017.1 cation:proton antiporter [Thalassolituus sp.]MDQ4424892.1 cation:proton antiporter [Thalassolituus sp.]|tara:strand:- start:3752 stop:4954 length:1203 start_codon:yes stop_codon:yes gene_type:complete